VRVETLTTVAPQPMEEIVRVARLHRCESTLLGLSQIGGDNEGTELEGLLSKLDSDVVVLRARPGWQLSETERVLVPVAGRGGHDYLLARLLGSLSRHQKRLVTFVRVVPTDTTPAALRRIDRDLRRMARDYVGSQCEREVIKSDDPVTAIAQRSEQSGLVILGIQRIGPRQKLFGEFTRRIATLSDCPIIVISRRG
jgi:hypothetical protein